MTEKQLKFPEFGKEPTKEMQEAWAGWIEHLLEDICEGWEKDYDLVDYRISKIVIEELTYFFLRDLSRIGDRQSEGIAGAKISGYLGFWIRKLKPIIGSEEFYDINERAAITVAISKCVDFESDRNIESYNRFTDVAKNFVLSKDRRNLEYIIHSMRYRTFGPHHLTTLLDCLLFLSSDETDDEVEALFI